MVNPLREHLCFFVYMLERVIYDKSIQGKSALLQFCMIMKIRELLCYSLCLCGNKYGRISHQMEFFEKKKKSFFVVLTNVKIVGHPVVSVSSGSSENKALFVLCILL